MSDTPTLAPLQGIPSGPTEPNRRRERDRYTSPEFSDREATHLWPSVWQIACRQEDIRQPGDVFLYQIVDQEIILVRQPDGEVKGLSNSCRHRGMPLIDGPSCGRTEFTCPFHGWTYNLDGTLQYVLSPDEFPCDRGYNLPEVRTGTWGGFIFVNLDPDAAPLEEYLAPVPDELEAYHLDQMTCTVNRTVQVPVNWKAAIEAFGESYHVLGTHPQLLTATDDVNTRYDSAGLHSRMVVPLFQPSPRAGEVSPAEVLEDVKEAFAQVGVDLLGGSGTAAGGDGAPPPAEDLTVEGIKAMAVGTARQMAGGFGIDVSSLTDQQFCEAHSWWLFPNVLLQTTPLQMFVWHCRPNGRDPGSCLMSQYVLVSFPPGLELPASTPEFYDKWEESGGGLILEQDWRNLFRWQRGMSSQTFDGPVFAEVQENGLTHFHGVLDGYLAGGGR